MFDDMDLKIYISILMQNSHPSGYTPLHQFHCPIHVQVKNIKYNI